MAANASSIAAASVSGVSRADPPEDRFDLAEGHLDRIEVGRIGRQPPQRRPGRFDQVTHVTAPMGTEIVEHYDLPSAQRRG